MSDNEVSVIGPRSAGQESSTVGSEMEAPPIFERAQSGPIASNSHLTKRGANRKRDHSVSGFSVC